MCVVVLQALLDKLNTQNQCSIKLPSLLAALGTVLEKGHNNVVARDKTGVSSSSVLGEGEVLKAGSADEESPKTRRLSPDSTAGCTDLSLSPNSRHCQKQTEATTSVTELSERGDCRIRNKYDAQALVGTVYHQLREAEQRRNSLSDLPPLLPATMAATIVTDAMPDCRLVVDQTLLELAAEARQIPAVGSEREALVQQVIRSVMEAHLKTCSYTREEVDANIQRYHQV